MAEGLTNHRWALRELLSYHMPLLPWVARTSAEGGRPSGRFNR